MCGLGDIRAVFWGPIHMYLVCIWYIDSLLFSLCFCCVFSFVFSKIVESNVVVVVSCVLAGG